jgi:hypothetical protein
MIYIVIWSIIISFLLGINIGKKTYYIDLKNKLKNRLKNSDESLLDYVKRQNICLKNDLIFIGTLINFK